MEALKFLTTVINPSPVVITPLPDSVFLNKITANVLNNIGLNPLSCSLASFLSVSLVHFISNPDSSSDLTIFILSSISSFEIIFTIVPNL